MANKAFTKLAITKSCCYGTHRAMLLLFTTLLPSQGKLCWW